MLKIVPRKFGANPFERVFLHRIQKINKQMKKIAILLVVGAIAFLYACGPTAKELEEKRVADSIRVADSLAMVQAEQQRIADSIAQAQSEEAHADSVAQGLIK
ncbi:MAG: hypothetical protein ABIJ04_00870 [Bacteroidota bacterium]